MVHSLFSARRWLDGSEDLLVTYGDIVYEPRVIEAVWKARADAIIVPVNLDWRRLWTLRFGDPLVDSETLRVDSAGRLLSIGERPRTLDDVQAQYMGLIFVPNTVQDDLVAAWAAGYSRVAAISMTEFLNALVHAGWMVRTLPVHGGWLEIDTPHDLSLYHQMEARSELSSIFDVRAKASSSP
jgi:choline kinase